jgi:NADP-reducing hydrogenase subunit HndC
VSAILQRGADWYAGYGTDKSKGTKTFALAGKIVRTGLIEVPLGITLREIIYGIGGGIPDGKRFKAVQTGGPSGGCLPESLLDLPVDYESLTQAGSIMGSGGMVVMDEDTCMVDVARYFLSFTQDESCGKCVPCRLGTKQMLDILNDITQGKGKPEDIDLLQSLGKQIKAGSLCGLGQTAPNPVLTTLRYFDDEYEAHIKEKRCPAMVCTELISYYILPDIDQDKCIRCGTCLDVCPTKFDAVMKVSGEEIAVPSEPVPVLSAKKGAETSGESSTS